MPYIIQKRRKDIDDGKVILLPGELNYKITTIIKNYLRTHGQSYNVFNDVVGVLENVKLEFYRRVVIPYEDQKIAEHGDVYEL